jgi:hypothetical protein
MGTCISLRVLGVMREALIDDLWAGGVRVVESGENAVVRASVRRFGCTRIRRRSTGTWWGDRGRSLGDAARCGRASRLRVVR